MYRKIIKRSLSNMRDSYLIYILACSFAIGVFGILLSMGDSPSVHEALHWWNSFIYEISTFMSGLFAFFAFVYMIYVGGFFIQRQKNEFLTFEKLGVSRWVIVMISFFQTAIVQIVAWLVGLLLMVIFQKFMGMLLFYLMQIRYNFATSFGGDTLLMMFWTFLFSTIILSLLNAIKTIRILRKKQRKINVKTRWWLRIPAGVFGIALLFSAQICTWSLFTDIRMISYSAKPLNEIFFILLADIFGTYLVYYGFLPTILNLLQKIHAISYSGLNLFSFKYLKERLFQNISILWFVTELSALALALLTFCYFGYQAVHESYDSSYPFELAANKDTAHFIRKELKQTDAKIKRKYKTNVKINLTSYYNKKSSTYMKQPMTFMSYSSYKSLPKQMRKGNSKINSNEFMKIDTPTGIMYQDQEIEYNIAVKGAPMIAKAKAGRAFPYGGSMHFGPMMIVPDKYYQNMPAEINDTFYGWNFKKGDQLQKSQAERLKNYRYAYYLKVNLKSSLKDSTIGVIKKAPKQYDASVYTQVGYLREGNVKKRFKQGGGFYLYIVALFSVALLIALGSVLTLRILLRDDYQSRQLRTLQKIGVEEKEIKRIILRENTWTFLIPIVFALVQSYTAIAMFDSGRHISKNIILIFGGYIVLYGLFGFISYQVSWRSIKQKFRL